MASIRYNVIIPAGGSIDSDYRKRIGVDVRALAPFGPDRVPVIQIVVDMLRNSPYTGKITIVGNEALQSAITDIDDWLPSTGNGIGNIIAGIENYKHDTHVLICASDLPLITVPNVDDFIRRIPSDVDLAAGIVTAASYNSKFYDASPSEFVTLREIGPVTMGGLFYINPSVLLRNEARIKEVFEARKSQWKMASLLGPALILQYITRRMRLKSIKERIEHLLKCKIGIVADIAPELAFDIDTADDYTYATRNYAGRRTNGVG